MRSTVVRARGSACRALLSVLALGYAAFAGAVNFPLKASPDGRYLMDQVNAPFRVQGDAAWDLLVTITSDEVDTYLANRAAKGVNTLLVELVEHRAYASGSPAPANRNGDRPFVSSIGGSLYAGANDIADLSTPNSAYFEYVDTILDKIAAKNMLVLLNPLYVGFGASTVQSASNEGWSADMHANSSANCYKYGQFVGDRYRSRSNIVWVGGGDAFRPASTITTCVQKVMDGIRDGKTNGNGGSLVMQTSHWARERMSTDDSALAVQVNSVYGSAATMGSLCRAAYGRAAVLPAYAIEAVYENEPGMTRAQLRRQDYESMLSCIGGYVYGNDPVWLFGSGWQSALDSVGMADFQRAGALMNGLAWQNLVPSNLGTLAGKVLAPGSDTAAGGDVTVAASPVALVAYVPSTGTAPRGLAIDMTALTASSRARWYNPVSGTFADISGGSFSLPNAGTRAFTTPGDNGTGANDWVLVLDTQGVAPAPPGGLRIVEYHHRGFDHYFVTADPQEIEFLDNGAFGGAWTRTGRSFDGYAEAINNAVPVCRFLSTSFGAKSSHFYTADAGECDIVLRNPDWQFESIAFEILVPDSRGNCPSGTVPVYRVYNNGQGGAPNHRFTTDVSTMQDFVDNRGYVSEGAGANGVAMCSPS